MRQIRTKGHRVLAPLVGTEPIKNTGVVQRLRKFFFPRREIRVSQKFQLENHIPDTPSPVQSVTTTINPPRIIKWDVRSHIPDKVKTPSQITAVPMEFCEYIGEIALLWGQFETEFDNFLDAMISLNGTGVSHPFNRRVPLKRRVKRFREEMDNAFAGRTSIYYYLDKLLNDAMGHQWKRNILLHGSHVTKIHFFSDGSEKLESTFMLEMYGNHNGEDITVTLTIEDMSEIYHDVGHICGRMSEISLSDCEKVESLPSSDMSFLRDFLLSNHRNRSILGQRPSQTESFPR